MEPLKCHFTRALISVMGVNPTVEINENKTLYEQKNQGGYQIPP